MLGISNRGGSEDSCTNEKNAKGLCASARDAGKNTWPGKSGRSIAAMNAVALSGSLVLIKKGRWLRWLK
jgi:hypothetical protein